MYFIFYLVYKMTNLFFDVLPQEIRYEIYAIRLNNALTNKYYKNISRKIALGYCVLKLQEAHHWGLYLSSYFSPYYNPENPMVGYVMERCSKFITNSDDRIWWISQLIRPIEVGLIIWGNYNTDPTVRDKNYMRTEYACDKLIKTLKCRKNPNRVSSNI
jgi:hypothetical protein